jgi:hypothetical protein
MTTKIRKRAGMLLAVPAVVGLGLVNGGAAAQAESAAKPMFEPANAAAFSCPSGNVCFYTGRDGTGSRCAWSVADPDWWGGDIRCSWSAERAPLSIYNHGTSSSYNGVVYYNPNGVRMGCTRQGVAGNLSGDYKVRSHHWTAGSCG